LRPSIELKTEGRPRWEKINFQLMESQSEITGSAKGAKMRQTPALS
jgi:hypothetical protein